ncbi:MAG: S46 family peptidase [Bacteroidales bacterium]|nr:S46 family peptidase [Bacteroidales bacterium]
MKKLTLLFSLTLILNTGLHSKTSPDEGMWLPIFIERLNYIDMQKMGLNLTAEEIYSINNSSIKDAIADLGGFCTAEVISDEGLIITNHHCGYDAIQKHSSVDHDYLTDGFWAMSKKEELPNEGLTTTFLVRIEDVTAEVLTDVTDTLSESERSKAIKKAIGKIEEKAVKDTEYDAEVRSFFNGNEYYLFVYETYEDVRLVGAPPSSIGNYGGDTDNWMWPRHTGDFSMFRIYTAPDGSPAKYSEENIPYKPKYHLPISLKGVTKDDFAMIWGFPGRTSRYMTSYGVEITLEQINPVIDNFGSMALDIMKEEMDKSDEVRIQYATTHAQIANFWKNKVGESKGLKRLKVYDKKKELENNFQKWLLQDPDRTALYGDVISDFEEAHKFMVDNKFMENLWYYQGGMFVSKALTFPMSNSGLKNIIKDKGDHTEALAPFKEKAEDHFKDYNITIEKKILTALLEIYNEKLAPSAKPDIMAEINKKYKGDYKKYVDDVFKNSIFTTETNYLAFLKKPSLKKLENDPLKKLMSSVFSAFMDLNGKMGELSSKQKKAKRLCVRGIREMQPNKVFYPDANSTMRFTYGKVLDYYPADAVHYDYVTHLSGLMYKEDPNNDEFIVPPRLKELFLEKDYGRYGKDGKMIVCFLTDNDITGGNSGSPVLNGDGQLIGLAFDGNWEAMSGNIEFEPALQRTINVDIRYVLFVIDKFAGASHLLDEMTIIE